MKACLIFLLMLFRLLIFLPVWGGTVPMEEWTGSVVKVADGDTFSVEYGGKIRGVRIIGVDAPETSDPRKPEQFGGAYSVDSE